MKTFRVHLKNGNSFTVKAHHFGHKLSAGVHATVPFFKDEKDTLDETILVMAGEVAAIVEQESDAAAATPHLPSSGGYQSY